MEVMSHLNEIEAADIPSNDNLGKVEAMLVLEMAGDVECQETYGARGAAIMQFKDHPIGLHGLWGEYVFNVGSS